MVNLDIRQTAVRGVRVTRGLFGARTTERFEQKIDRVAASDPFDVPNDAQVQAIGSLITQGKIFPGEPVSCCLPGYLVSTHRLTLPFRDPEKLRQAIPFEMEERLPFELDEVVIDHHPAGGGTSDFFVFTAQKTVLQKYVAAFDRLGLSCVRIGVDLLALDEAFRRAGPPPEGDLFLIDLGASKTQVCFLREGALCAVRALPIGGDALTLALTPAQASGGTASWHAREEAKQAIDLDDIREDRTSTAAQKSLILKLHEWMREIEKVMAQTPVTPQRRAFCLVGGGAKMKGLTRLLASQWGIPATEAPAELQTIAAGDRNATSPFRPRLHEVNFLRPVVEVRPVSSSGAWIAACCLIVVIGLAAADFSLRYRQKEARYRTFKTEMQRRFSTLFPEEKNVAGREMDFLRSALARLGKTENDLAMGRAGAYATFKTLSLALPEMASMEVHMVDVNDNEIRMEMQTDSFPLVDQVRAHLLKEPRFSEVTVSDAKVSADTSKVRFRIQITLTQPPSERG